MPDIHDDEAFEGKVLPEEEIKKKMNMEIGTVFAGKEVQRGERDRKKVGQQSRLKSP